jgi:hypothetical protein
METLSPLDLGLPGAAGDLCMFGFSGAEILWFALTFVAGVVMWGTRVGPSEAASNISAWAITCGIKDPPQWLRARKTDRRVRAGAVIALAGLLFWGGMLFDGWLRSFPGKTFGDVRLISEIGIKRDGNDFVRDASVVQNSVDHWEALNDGTFLIQFPRQIDPNTLVVRESGEQPPLAIVERGPHKVRFKLPPSAIANGSVHIIVEGG